MYSPNPGSSRSSSGRRGQLPPRRPSELPCGAVEVARARVVAESRPGGENALLARAGQGPQIRKTPKELAVSAADRADGRLLEHHLGDPDAVGVPRAAPGEAALLAPKPGEQLRPDEIVPRGRLQETVTSVRGAIQPGSFISSRTNFFSSSFGSDLGGVLRVGLGRQELSPVTEYVFPDELADRAMELHVGRRQRRCAGRQQAADRLRGASPLPAGRARAKARSGAPCRARAACLASS